MDITKTKPTKPTPDFPLYPHGSGKWAKSIGGKKKYFGVWENPAGALNEYESYLKSIDSEDKLNSTKGEHVQTKMPAGFTLNKCANGQWRKKIRGKTHYFGPHSYPQAAWDLYLTEKSYWEAGEIPPSRLEPTTEMRLDGLVKRYLTDKKALLDSGGISTRTHKDHITTCKMLIANINKHTPISEIGESQFSAFARNVNTDKIGKVYFWNVVRRTKAIFNYAFNDLKIIDRVPTYGPLFKEPSTRALRIEKATRTAKFFEVEEVKALLEESDETFKAMILLALNCGFGNADIAMLTLDDIDLENGSHIFPRPKTGVQRRCLLWPETIKSIKDYLKVRPEPRAGQEDYVFITKYGNNWCINDDSVISSAFVKICKKTDTYKKYRGFNSFRHMFQTIGRQTGLETTVSYCMGHVSGKCLIDMLNFYWIRRFNK